MCTFADNNNMNKTKWQLGKVQCFDGQLICRPLRNVSVFYQFNQFLDFAGGSYNYRTYVTPVGLSYSGGNTMTMLISMIK